VGIGWVRLGHFWVGLVGWSLVVYSGVGGSEDGLG
jgi:hypothetical protein